MSHAVATRPAVAAGSAVADRPRSWQRWLAVRLVPTAGPRTRWFEAVGLFVVLAVLTFFRFGSAAVHARVWAEDGSIFLTDAAQRGRLQSLPDTYAGYGHLLPRLVASVVVSFPVGRWGVLVHIADALVVAAVAAIVYVALGNLLPGRAPRLVGALYVALVPVGPEVVGSIANLQWFLVVGAVVVLFWTPQRVIGWVIQCVTVFAAVTCSPVGALILVGAVVRLVLQRGRGPWALAVTTLVGVVLQAVEQFRAPPRPFTGATPFGESARGYVSRVAGDGVLGIDRWIRGVPTTDPSFGITSDLTAGIVVLVVAAAVVLLAFLARWQVPWLPALVFFVLSIALFASALARQLFMLDNVQIPGRYFVPPAILLVLALIVLAGVLAPQARTSPTGVAGSVARWLVPAAALVLVGSLAFGVVTSYNEARLRGRNDTTTWAKAVRTAKATCRGPHHPRNVEVPILPAARVWTVAVRCSRLR